MAFPALETHNGHMPVRVNACAARLADLAARAEVGGSDAHAMASVGCAWTAVPGARNRQEYLEGLRRGQGRVRGESGSIYKLTRDVLAIGSEMVREDFRTLPLIALAPLVPAVTLGNYVLEHMFARWWMARHLRARKSGRQPARIAEVIAC
jgi:hypothetical protein